MSLNLATLPGVGKIVEPRPDDYRVSAAWLANNLKRHPHPRYQGCTAEFDPRRKALFAILRTLCRLEWTPARLRQARAA